MTSEIFIENNRLDISEEISSLITFELDSLKDFSSRSTSWSKTIVLPGTANNNQVFGNIFQVGQANQYFDTLPNVGVNFNAAKSAFCIILQDSIQSFKGVLRLMRTNKIGGRYEYEVAVFGELAGLTVALNTGKLEDLDFSDYDHVYSAANVTASWENVSGVSYYYPLIDHGNYSSIDKKDWDIRTFRPALHVREYIDKMFTAVNYRWSSDLFNTDRFKRLIVPNNKKTLQKLTTRLIQGIDVSTQVIIQDGVAQEAAIPQALRNISNFTYSGGVYTYTGTDPATFTLQTVLNGDYYSTIEQVQLQVKKNGSQIYTTFLPPTGGTTDTNFTNTFPDISVGLVTGDTLQVSAKVANNVGSYRLRTTFVRFEAYLAAAIFVDVNVGDTVIMNDAIPRNIRQLDFLIAIVKLFNLYVYEDRNDSRLIYFKPYVDFYSTDPGNSVDWTYKLNRDKAIKVKPMSELTARKYDFKYKPDSDYYNDLYKKRYNQGYGDYVFDSQFEFAEASKSLEILFSATVLVGYSGEDKVMSTIFKKTGTTEEQTDSNIRILQSRKITGVASWDIKDVASVLASQTFYGYAGHLDDPDAPSNDLNFGALNELFFILATGDLSNTQFNVYWSSYMAEITDKDSKLMNAFFYLKPQDIQSLDFSVFVYVDGVLFRLQSIKDYNTSKPSDVEVELLKVNFLIY